MSGEGPTISLSRSTILNRLGDSVVVAAFINQDHFIPLHPRDEMLNVSLDIKWFHIQGPNGPGQCFIVPQNVTVNKASVISLRLPEGSGIPLFYHFPAEAPDDAQCFELQPIDDPAQSEDFLHKLVTVSNYAMFTKGMKFPRSALHELLDDIPAANSAPPVAMFAATSGAGPKDTPTPPKGDLDKLMDLLSDNGKPPAQQVSEDKAPKPPITNVKPSEADSNAEALQCYKDIKLVTGLACLFQEILRLKKMQSEGRTAPYGISDPTEANLAMKENADLAYQVMHGGLGGYYDSINMYQRSYNKTVKHSDLKIEFTSDIFKPFGFTKPALTEISGFLEQYIAAIAKVKTDTTSTGFRNSFSKQIHQVLRINVGDDENPVWVWQPKCRLVYMHVDSASYRETVKTCLKESTQESYKFSMDYVVVEADINTENVERRREKLTKAFDMVSDKNIDAFVSQAGVANEVTDKTPTQDGM
ncbi:hypothetical protein BDV27DRAFT_143788 [Aspergillus caelatus]|uniref:Uncharacterized protein n=1 Tax=Aspergillus caelatus TaxID=61420 RepID=A0A5N7AA85_9EURO|nr:uncharacterized protein BDV27DRAFT_143788 [Aspergillus caelatus]KAE8366278.1 hypothetical protein BDV27DRAFT_143788 [Aspergillus caelatus]